MIKVSQRITLAAISLFGLLNILLIPYVGGGMFPDDFEPQFFETIEYFGDAADLLPGYLFALPYLLPVLVVASCIFMLVSSLIGHKGLCIASGSVGIAFWIIPFIVFFADASDHGADFEEIIEALFDSDYGLVAIGTVLALIVFIAYLIVAAVAKKPNAAPYTGYPYQGNFQNNNQNPYQYQNNFQNNNQNGYQYQNNYQNNQNTYQAQSPTNYATPNTNTVNATPYTNNDVTSFSPNTEVAAEDSSATDIYANSGVTAEVVEPVAEPVAEPVEPVVTEPAPAAADAKFCPNCGTKADADSIFCGSCGHKF